VPGVAWADQEITAGTPNRYTTPSVTMDQGEPLTFRNNDIANHDVTHRAADSKPLFRSEIIGQGETSFVEGSQYLTTGTYEFFCSVHPEMRGTLTVTANGTPQQRPGAGGGGTATKDTQEPAVALELGEYAARKVRRTRRVRFLVGADEGAVLTVTVWVGRRRAARRQLEIETQGTRRIGMRLSKKAARRVRKGRRLVVLVRAEDAAGNVGTDKRSVKFR